MFVFSLFSTWLLCQLPSASFRSCLHGKLCDKITTVCVVIFKGFSCWLLQHCCAFHIVKFVIVTLKSLHLRSMSRSDQIFGVRAKSGIAPWFAQY